MVKVELTFQELVACRNFLHEGAKLNALKMRFGIGLLTNAERAQALLDKAKKQLDKIEGLAEFEAKVSAVQKKFNDKEIEDDQAKKELQKLKEKYADTLEKKEQLLAEKIDFEPLKISMSSVPDEIVDKAEKANDTAYNLMLALIKMQIV